MQWTVTVLAGLAAANTAIAGDDPTAASLIPDNAALVVTIRDADTQIDALREFSIEHRLNEKVFELAQTNPGIMAAWAGLLGLAGAAAMQPWEAIASVTGDNVAVSLVPRGDEEPALLAVASLTDPKKADRFLESIALAIGVERARGLIKDGKILSISDDLHICRDDTSLIVSNERDLVRQARRLARGKGTAVSTDPDFIAQKDRVPNEAVAWAFSDPDFVNAVVQEGQLPEKLDEPLVGLVLGGWYHAMRNADNSIAWLLPEDDGLRLVVEAKMTDDLPVSHMGFSPADLTDLTFDAVDLPNFLAEVRVGRDWSALFNARETLLDVNAAGGLVEFANTMSAIMGGLDFIDDVLARVNGPVRLIATNQDFSDLEHRPTPELPAFALVAPIDTDEEMAMPMRVTSAALSALSVVNIERAQTGQSALLLRTEQVNDKQIVSGTFVANENEPPSIEHNFEPSIAMIDDRLVVTSSSELMKTLATHITDRRSPQPAGPDLATFDGDALAGILLANEEELIASRMIEENVARDDAASDVRLFIDGVRLIEHATLRSSVDADTYRADLRVMFRPPEAEAKPAP